MSKLWFGKLCAGLCIFCFPTDSKIKLKDVKNLAMDSDKFHSGIIIRLQLTKMKCTLLSDLIVIK